MNRPYIICHILTSLDGRISGNFFKETDTALFSAEYRRISEEFNVDAYAYGSTTLAEGFTHGTKPDLSWYKDKSITREDYVAKTNAEKYLIAVDPYGTLGWEMSVVTGRGRGQDGAHVIEVLCENVSDEYLAFLQDKGISYIFSGKEQLELSLAAEKLKRIFGIKRISLQGGGVTNGSFAGEDLIDEISMVIAPAADCGSDVPTMFETEALAHPMSKALPFKLNDVKRPQNSGVWLDYIRKR